MARRPWSIISSLTLVGAMLAGCVGSVQPPNAAVRDLLAPSGKLRVGLYAGSPTSIVGSLQSGTAKGVGFDLGQALAKRLGVPFEPVVFSKNAEVLAAVKAAQVDVSFTNATAERARDMDFSPTVLEVEKGYLVPAASPMEKPTDLDRPGVRIGVSQGSSTQQELSNVFQHATLQPTATLKSAIEMLASGQLEAFATNKAILFEMSDALPGSRVLNGRWGSEQFALALPKGREQAGAWLRQVVMDMKSQGQVAQAVQRAGLRGTASATAQ